LEELQRSAFVLLERMLPTVVLTPRVVDDADRVWRSERSVSTV
jgi:serine protease inhibitor ecotin